MYYNVNFKINSFAIQLIQFIVLTFLAIQIIHTICFDNEICSVDFDSFMTSDTR